MAHQREHPLPLPCVLARLSDRSLQVYAEDQQEQNLNVLLYFVFTLTLLTLYKHCCTAASFASEPIILQASSDNHDFQCKLAVNYI